MGDNMNQLEGGRLYIEGQSAGEIGEFTTEPEEIPDTLHLNDSAEFTGTITFTPERAAAMVELLKPVIEETTRWLREMIEKISKVFGIPVEVIQSNMNGNLMDAMLYAVNDNPKWWHLYKHAKKYRTRKKYWRRLMQQL